MSAETLIDGITRPKSSGDPQISRSSKRSAHASALASSLQKCSIASSCLLRSENPFKPWCWSTKVSTPWAAGDVGPVGGLTYCTHRRKVTCEFPQTPGFCPTLLTDSSRSIGLRWLRAQCLRKITYLLPQSISKNQVFNGHIGTIIVSKPKCSVLNNEVWNCLL